MMDENTDVFRIIKMSFGFHVGSPQCPEEYRPSNGWFLQCRTRPPGSELRTK